MGLVFEGIQIPQRGKKKGSIESVKCSKIAEEMQRRAQNHTGTDKPQN